MYRHKRIGVAFLILVSSLLCLSAGALTHEELERGIQLFDEGKYSEAKTFFESYLNQNPENAVATFYLGKIVFIDEEDYDASIEWFKKAIELDQNNSEYHHWLGRAYGMKAQKASILKKASLAGKVRSAFEKAVELDPDNVDARFDLIQYYLQAPGFMGGSTEKAMEQAEEITKRNSKLGHRALRQVYEKEEKYGLAEQDYLSEIGESPQDLDLYYQLGYFYTNQKKFAEAVKTFEKVLMINPEAMNAYYQIGRVGAISGQNLIQAEDCFKKYLQYKPKENDPSLAWAHYRLGMVYEHKGEKDLAKKEYETAFELEPDHKEAKEALKKLK